jgi:DNA topoisomerase-1
MNIPNMADDFTLIIVESPAKCKKIESYLGPKYKCIASYGHLRELKDMEAIKIEQNFTPIFTEMPDKTTQINKIRTLIKKADEVLLASDADREGEAIAWHICDMFSLPIDKTKRIVFNEVTEQALQIDLINALLLKDVA